VLANERKSRVHIGARKKALRFLFVFGMQIPLGRADGFEGRGHCVAFDVRL
jgi:hypothetical protein